jgi:type IV secretory pathway TraG/TraD family ATPase VirD4
VILMKNNDEGCGCFGKTGSGKEVSVTVPYIGGSIVCFDTKGDVCQPVAKRCAAMGQRIIRLAPFNSGEDSFNPLDAVSCDSDMSADSAGALVRGPGPDPEQLKQAESKEQPVPGGDASGSKGANP